MLIGDPGRCLARDVASFCGSTVLKRVLPEYSILSSRTNTFLAVLFGAMARSEVGNYPRLLQALGRAAIGRTTKGEQLVGFDGHLISDIAA